MTIVVPRLPDWRARFAAAMDEIRYVPFDWQTQHDCGLGLAARMVLAMTGQDLAAQYRGKYKTSRGALSVMKRAGFDNLADMTASILPEMHPALARVGDIAAFEMEDSPFGYAIGVVNGERVFVLRPEGIGTMDLLSANRAFKVG